MMDISISNLEAVGHVIQRPPSLLHKNYKRNEVAKFKDPHDACATVVAESYRLWLQNETHTHDITIIVVLINGLHDHKRKG
jgi:hypothetical protein